MPSADLPTMWQFGLSPIARKLGSRRPMPMRLSRIENRWFVTALVAPAVSFLYGAFIPGPHGWWLLIALGWCVAGIILHLLARGILGRLQP